MFALFNFIEVDERTIGNLGEVDLEDDVRVNGIVMDVKDLEGAVIINVGQLNKIDVIVFDDVEIKKGDSVEVDGVMEEYNGQLEIIADKIVLK